MGLFSKAVVSAPQSPNFFLPLSASFLRYDMLTFAFGLWHAGREKCWSCTAAVGTPNVPLEDTQESPAHGGAVPSWCLAWLRCSCCVGCVLRDTLHAQQKIGESCLMPCLDSRTRKFLNIFSVFQWDLVDYCCHVWVILNCAMVLIFIYSRQIQSWNKQVQLQGKP